MTPDGQTEQLQSGESHVNKQQTLEIDQEQARGEIDERVQQAGRETHEFIDAKQEESGLLFTEERQELVRVLEAWESEGGSLKKIKPFDVGEIKHKRIERFRPDYIARGGENLVYALPDYPDYVAKVDIASLVDSITNNVQQDKKINGLPSKQEREKITAQIEEENKQHILLKQYFGEEHVLEKTKHRLKVPLSKNLVQQVYEARHQKVPDGLGNQWQDEAWATVTLQQKAPEIGTPTQYGIVAGYTEIGAREKSASFHEAYNQLTEAFVLHPEKQQQISDEQLLTVHPNLMPLLDEINRNPQAREMLTDFVQKAIKYTQETGKILDLGSLDNVTFYKTKDGLWNYRLVDPVHSLLAGDQIGQAKKAAEKLAEGSADLLDYYAIFGPINYVRVVNALAQKLEIPSYIKMRPDNIDIDAIQISEVIQKAIEKEDEILKQLAENARIDSSPKHSSYEVTDVDHRRVEKYKPQYLGHGVEHIAYALPDYPDRIAKVAMRPLIVAVDHDLQTGKKLDLLSPEMRIQFAEEKRTAEEHINVLQVYYGEDHILRESKHLLKVPITRDLLTEVYKTQHRDTPRIPDNLWANETWAEVTIQEKANELEDPSHISPLIGWIEAYTGEDLSEYQQDYEKLTDALVLNPANNSEIDIHQLIRFYPALQHVIQTALVDEGAKGALKDFVQKTIRLTNETGEIVDILGKDNVTFYKDNDGAWNYHIIDVAPPSADRQLDQVKQIIKRIASGEEEARFYHFIGTPVNYARAMNGLAKFLDVNDYISLLPDETTITSRQIWEGTRSAIVPMLHESKTEKDNILEEKFDKQGNEFSKTMGMLPEEFARYKAVGEMHYQTALLLTEGIPGAYVTTEREAEDKGGALQVVNWYVPSEHQAFFEKRRGEYIKTGIIIPFTEYKNNLS